MRNTRNKMDRINAQHAHAHEQHPCVERHEVELRGHRTAKAASNSLRFLATVEGVSEYDGRVRSANGMRWRMA